MKYTFTSLILTILTFSSFGQWDFVPHQGYTTWTGREYNNGAAASLWTQFKQDSINADTLINAVDYKKMSVNDNFFLAYRVDSAEKAIYFIPKDSTQEELFFDYDATLAVDDTVFIPHYTYLDPGELSGCYFKLFSVDSFQVSGQYFKEYDFFSTNKTDALTDQYPGFCNDRIRLAERLICAASFPFTGEFFFETFNELRCYAENDTPLYASELVTFGSWTIADCPYDAYPTTVDIKDKQLKVELYPNPSYESVNVMTNGLVDGVIRVYDQAGKQMSVKAFSKQVQIDISDWAAGLYIYQIHIQGELVQGKFIKAQN